MAIINIDQINMDLFAGLDNFIDSSYVESICQYGFIFMKGGVELSVYLNQKTGIHSAQINIENNIVSALHYHKKNYIMLYDQSIYFEHEREGCREKVIGVDTENMTINVSLLDNLSPARKEWLEASPEKLKNHRLLKDGIRCTSEADRGKNIFYKCLFCETMISSVPKDSVGCKCGSITIDVDMVRLWVKNLTKIQVLEKIKSESVSSKMGRGSFRSA